MTQRDRFYATQLTYDVNDIMDIVTQEKRAEMMANILSRDTKPEILVRKAIFHSGYRYKLNVKIYNIRPDIVLRKQNIAIFVHGCFWHRHTRCKLAYTPKSRTKFWKSKFEQNMERDRKVIMKLQLEGWRIAVIWECATRDKELFEKTMNSLNEWITSSSDYFES